MARVTLPRMATLIELAVTLGAWPALKAAAAPPPGPSLNVRDFGARGDGVTDDYPALQALVRRVNAAGGGRVYFPPGTYRINRYRITGGPDRNDVQNITFVGCKGLHITGRGAKIDVRGNFRRTADRRAGVFWESERNSVVPLAFVDCHDLSVEGLELDGNVDRMTRDPGVIEGYTHGLVTRECSNYIIRNVYIHHFASDGIYLGDSNTKADRNAKLIGVRSANNARQGMTVSQLRGGTFSACRFEDTGVTGAYGGHAPLAGVDVEPNGAPPAVDVRTGNLLFAGCKFLRNEGPAFQCGQGASTENVTLRKCTVDRGRSRYPHTIIMAVPGGTIEDSSLLVNGIAPTWSGSTGVRTVVRRCRIVSPWNHAIRLSGEGAVIIEANSIRQGRGRAPDDYTRPPGPRVVIKGNTTLPGSTPARR